MAGFEKTLGILSPENVLKRGYTITSYNGRILKKQNRLKTDDIIDTQFSDGSVSSRIIERKDN
jgi:exodeoxyribonuclease VII large subunit